MRSVVWQGGRRTLRPRLLSDADEFFLSFRRCRSFLKPFRDS